MKGSAKAGFQVTDHGVKPAEFRKFLGMAAISDHWLMNASHLYHSPEASQPIGDDLTTSYQGDLCPVCDGCEGEGGHLGHLHVNWVPSIIKGNGSYDRDFVL